MQMLQMKDSVDHGNHQSSEIGVSSVAAENFFAFFGKTPNEPISTNYVSNDAFSLEESVFEHV
jgi:hypothetical protein